MWKRVVLALIVLLPLIVVQVADAATGSSSSSNNNKAQKVSSTTTKDDDYYDDYYYEDDVDNNNANDNDADTKPIKVISTKPRQTTTPKKRPLRGADAPTPVAAPVAPWQPWQVSLLVFGILLGLGLLAAAALTVRYMNIRRQVDDVTRMINNNEQLYRNVPSN